VSDARWQNVPEAADYVRLIESGQEVTAERRDRPPRERVEEALFMGLRLTEGVSLDRILRDHGCDAWRIWGDRLAPFVASGLLLHEGGRLRLTRRGMLLSNEIMSAFIEDGSTVK
jgi:oxygen-independent coproporphyrinogen-3 oxidase